MGPRFSELFRQAERHFDRKHVLLSALSIFTVFSGECGSAQSTTQLCVYLANWYMNNVYDLTSTAELSCMHLKESVAPQHTRSLPLSFRAGSYFEICTHDEYHISDSCSHFLDRPVEDNL